MPRAFALALVLACALTISTVASAAKVTEFPISGGAGNIKTGPDGNLWFIGGARTGVYAIGRITPSGKVTEFTAGVSAQPHDITPGPDGDLWFTENSAIGRITPTGVVTEFPVAGFANGITAGPDGNLWFTRRDAMGRNAIGRLTPTGIVTEFSQNIDPRGGLGAITAGRDGNLWFTESNEAGTASRIGRITPSGKVTEFSRGISGSPQDITTGPDGNMWFTEGYGVIGRITPNGKVTEFSRGVPGLPGEITAAADGNLWFTDTGSNDVGPVSAVGRITPQGRVRIFTRGITQGFSDSQGSQPTGITAGPDGNVWFTEFGDPAHETPPAIGRITTDALISVRARVARVSARGSVSVQLACGKGSSGRCAGKLTVFEQTRVRLPHSRRSRVDIVELSARAVRFSIAAGRPATVKLALDRTGRQLLAHAEHHRLSLLAKAMTPANTARKRIVLVQ